MVFLFAFSADLIVTILTRINKVGTIVPTYLFETLYHLFIVAGVFVWGIYAEIQYAAKGSDRKIRWVESYLRPALPPILIILTNFLTQKLFYVNKDGVVVEDVLYHFEMGYLLICSLYYFVKLYRASRNEHDQMKRSHMIVSAVFPVGILIGWLLSFIGHDIPVLCVMIAMGLLVLFIGTMFFRISIDWLTQVNNRQNLMDYLGHKMRNHSDKLYLLMLDIDGFKQINDRYGHIEGDNALIETSAGIKQACGPVLPRPFIARYGGDEFTVVMEAESVSAAQSLSEKIRTAVAAKSGNKPYDLTISVGIAEHQKGQKAKQLIDAADDELYKVKRELKAEKRE